MKLSELRLGDLVCKRSHGEKQMKGVVRGTRHYWAGVVILVEWEDGTSDYVSPNRLDYYYED